MAANMSAAAVAQDQRKHLQETPQETIVRKQSSFADVEKTMPHLPSRFRDVSIVDNLTSYLGRKNPFKKSVDPEKHLVWLFDNTAFQTKHGWEAEFTAAYFVKNSGKDVSRIAADIAEKCGLGEGDVAEATIAKRLEPFADAILPAHTVNVTIEGDATKTLGPSGRDGISSHLVHLPPAFTNGQTTTSEAIGVSNEQATTFFASPTGWAVLSDVDDTIKITLTEDPIGILKTTFVDTPTPIPGMPELYKYISQELGQPPFWYLSASPYNLYPFLRTFQRSHYPAGQLILREASWMNLAGLLTNLTQGTQAYKTSRIAHVHSQFPHRSFLLIGDSTQTDPESYGEMYARNPAWIKGIFIRRVEGIPSVSESKNSNERFKKAFKKVPRDVWHVFADPQELYPLIDNLVATGSPLASRAPSLATSQTSATVEEAKGAQREVAQVVNEVKPVGASRV